MLIVRIRSLPTSVLFFVMSLALLLIVTPRIHAAGLVCTVAASGGTYSNLEAAIADTGCTTIQVAAGTFATNTTINRSVIIEGLGTTQTRLDGGGTTRFLRVLLLEPNARVELRNLAVVNGDAGNPAGGGIYNSGILTMTNVLVQGNVGGGTGGIYNNGTLTIVESTITQNRGRSSGAILNDGALTLRKSTVIGNTGTTSGIINTNQLTVENSTVSGNSSEVGSVINNFSGTTSISFTTIASNIGGFVGGAVQSSGLFNPGSGTFNIRATIVANNGPGPNCAGTITSQGYNISDDATCGLTGTGDKPSTDPLLGLLAENGGLTQTHALLPESPAVDAVQAGSCPITDQRGSGRPRDGNGADGAACDIGAFELAVLNNRLFLPLLKK